MTAVVDLDGPASAVPPAPPVQDDQSDEQGALPVRGLTALAGSAGFAIWTSLTCFVC